VWDWNSTDGTLVDVRPKTAARWRRIISDFWKLQRHISARTKPRAKIQKVA
jgi:hypothetical protein